VKFHAHNECFTDAYSICDFKDKISVFQTQATEKAPNIQGALSDVRERSKGILVWIVLSYQPTYRLGVNEKDLPCLSIFFES